MDNGRGLNGLEKEKLFGSALRMNSRAVGLGLGLLLGSAIFVGTNWLIIKGGENVGMPLALLGQFFIGYKVSFLGSLIGFAYGFALGTLGGAMISWVYNGIARLRARLQI